MRHTEVMHLVTHLRGGALRRLTLAAIYEAATTEDQRAMRVSAGAAAERTLLCSSSTCRAAARASRAAPPPGPKTSAQLHRSRLIFPMDPPAAAPAAEEGELPFEGDDAPLEGEEWPGRRRDEEEPLYRYWLRVDETQISRKKLPDTFTLGASGSCVPSLPR